MHAHPHQQTRTHTHLQARACLHTPHTLTYKRAHTWANTQKQTQNTYTHILLLMGFRSYLDTLTYTHTLSYTDKAFNTS